MATELNHNHNFIENLAFVWNPPENFQDLVTSFGINRATTLLLAGSGSGARFVTKMMMMQKSLWSFILCITIFENLILSYNSKLLMIVCVCHNTLNGVSIQGGWIQLRLCGGSNGWGDLQNLVTFVFSTKFFKKGTNIYCWTGILCPF